MSAARRTRHRSLPPFEIWQTPRRIVSVDNPVQLQILAQIEEGPKTLKHLVAAVRKSKPTLSALHLPPLLEAEVVTEATDPNDARVKWYKLHGQRLGSSSVAPAALRDAVLRYVESAGMVPLRPVLAILDPDALVRHAPPAYVREVAQRLGNLVARSLLRVAPSERVAELSAILEREAIARVEYRRQDLIVKAKSRPLQAFAEELVAAAMRTPTGAV